MIRKINDNDYSKLAQYYEEFNVNNVDIFESSPFINIYVYEENGSVVGFINYSIMYDRTELNYIYVEKEYRKKGIASELMDYFISDAKKNNCKNITLEVAENNFSGIELYKKYDFKEVAKRKNYYKDSDGILMLKELINDGK